MIAGRCGPQRSRRGDESEGIDEPLLIEVMGPAASGKSTLVAALCDRDARIHAGLDLTKVDYARRSLGRLGGFLGIWLRLRHRDRWLDRREMRSIARLETWSHALDTKPKTNGSVAIFDHGPLYRLARLRAFGPALTRSEPFQRWWRSSFTTWSAALDIVIMLEASDAVLLRRVDERGHWYLSGDIAEKEKRAFLDRYRKALDQIVAEAGQATGPTGTSPAVLRFPSHEMSVEAISTEVLCAIEAKRTNDPRGRRP